MASTEDSSYAGEEGGLYPGGTNYPPPEHLNAGLERAERIVPRAPDGEPADDGKIGLLSIGLSNTNSEFQVFMHLISVCDWLNPALVIVNGAQPRKSAEIMQSEQTNYWPTVDRKLKKQGITREQVQVIWLKSALKGPTAPFPAEVNKLYECLQNTMNILADRFPNLQIVYMSSRAYGGYSEIPLSPEPHAYESGFSVKWLIRDQIAGKPELNYDPEKGPVRSPWLSWGPYLWADGIACRETGELFYEREDLIWDGVHPSPRGREKVAGLLFEFMLTDPTATRWFLRSGLMDDLATEAPSYEGDELGEGGVSPGIIVPAETNLEGVGVIIPATTGGDGVGVIIPATQPGESTGVIIPASPSETPSAITPANGSATVVPPQTATPAEERDPERV